MHELNEEIRDKEIRLIGSEGEQLGIMPPAEALKIADGNRVKVSVRFRGREMAHTDIGRDLLDRFAAQCAETANLDKPAKLEGRMMSIFLSPKSGK